MADTPTPYPTKTRLALLRAVNNGQVLTDMLVDEFRAVLFPDAPTSWLDRQIVTARMRELEMAGWVEEQASTAEWRLTQLGTDVLNAYGEDRRA